MCLNRISVWKVMTVWISREVPLFNFERLNILCTWIGHPNEKLWPFQFRASRYIIRLNRTSEWKVMTIWISRELPLFNFENLDIWCASIGHPSENLRSFKFLESFRCSISSFSIYYAPGSDIRVKSYDHLNFSRSSVVQFRASPYVMCLNRISVWKVMTVWISREVPLFNFERLDIWCAWIGHPSEKLWQFYFLERFRCLISSVSIYYAPESDFRMKRYDHFNFEHLNILYTWIGHPSERLWPFQFLESFRCSISSVSICDVPESDLRVIIYDHLNFSRASVVQFRASQYMMCLNRTSEWKVMRILISRELPLFNFERLDMWSSWIGPLCDNLWPFEFLESFRCSISSISICDVPQSDLRVKGYDHFNFSRASVVQFRASRYVMFLNRTSEWKVMTILISREHPLFNFERLDILCAWIAPPDDKLWPFDFLQRFRCSISGISICDVPQSDLRVKSYDHLNFSRASVV